MVDNLALVIAHGMMGLFLWRVIAIELKRSRDESAENVRKKPSR